MASWAKKELAKIRIYKSSRLLLPRINSAPVSSSQKLPAQEIVVEADLRCPMCQKRVTGAISSIQDVESVVVNVEEKKVTLTRKSVANGSSPKAPAVFNNLVCKTSRNPLRSFHA